MQRRYGAVSAFLACALLAVLGLVVASPAEAAKAPPWRWKTVETTRTVEPNTEEDVVLYCPASYQPVAMSWDPSSFYVRRLFETYNHSSRYGYLRLVNVTSSITVTVAVKQFCVHSDDLGAISTTTATIAHPTTESSVGGYVDCPGGQTALTGSITWDGFAAGRTIDFSTPTEVGWYASGRYPVGQSASFKVSVHCVASGVMAGAHLAQGSGVISHSPGSIAVTATCAAGERAVGTGAFQYPSTGSVNPYAELGTTLMARQALPLNGAGSFTASVSSVNSSAHTVVARAWCVPYPKPVINFVTKPPAVQSSPDVTLTFNATDTAGDTVTVLCYLNGNPLACTSGQPVQLTLGDGQHSFGIRATNSVPAEKLELFSTTIDTTPPAVTLTQKPTNPSASTSASFTMSVNDLTSVTRYCHLDDAVEQVCPNPATFTGLAAGQHTFHWRVVDSMGHQSVGEYGWLVDTADPIVNVTGKPAAVTPATSASFTVSAEDETATQVHCRLDDETEQPCPTPASYSGLTDGLHTFHWRAVDQAGNQTVGSHTWRVDTTAPTATLTAPTTPFTLTSARVSWSGTDGTGSGLASWQLRAQSAPWNGGFGAWSAPVSYPAATTTTTRSLARGLTYCWQVRSVDKAGHPSAWSGRRCTSSPLDDRALTATARWVRTTGAAYYAGTATQTKVSGQVLTRTGAVLKRVALVATKCPTCGLAGVYVNGVRVGVVDLYRATTAHRQLVVLPVFSLRSGTVTVRVLSSGEPVIIDGLGISRE